MNDLLAPGWARPLVQLVGSVRKEIVDVARQPRLLGLLVLGPFAVLTMFALGFDQGESDLTTVFVGPEGDVYEEAVDAYGERIRDLIEPLDYSTDLIAAQRRLESGEVDLVVQFPPDARGDVGRGEQATINVYHDKLDPIQQRTVEIAAQLAVLELNAEILEQVLSASLTGDSEVTSDDASGGEDGEDGEESTRSSLDERVMAIRGHVDDQDVPAAKEEAAALERESAAAARAARLSSQLSEQLEGEVTEQEQEQLDAFATTADQMSVTAGRLAEADDDALGLASTTATALEGQSEQLAESGPMQAADPAVLARPFASRTEQLSGARTSVVGFFVPNSIVLLLGHLALTIAAMGLVRGEALGLFELYRVGPVGTPGVLAGAYTSHLALGGLAGAVLTGAAVAGLGVPMRGSWWYLAGGLLLLLLGSIGLGLVLALVSRSDTQAVQASMLVLLAGLFFGGFFIGRDQLFPFVQAVAALLPVSHGISLLQDVMLRGDPPAVVDALGLVGTSIGYAVLASVLLHRRLRIEDEETG